MDSIPAPGEPLRGTLGLAVTHPGAPSSALAGCASPPLLPFLTQQRKHGPGGPRPRELEGSKMRPLPARAARGQHEVK